MTPGHDGVSYLLLMNIPIPRLSALVIFLQRKITSTIKLFADDTKIYRELNNVDDTFALQSDLDSLENWTKSWQVKFNSEKCEVMRITHKQDKSTHPYYLSNTELRFVDSYKDLGVNMSRFILVESCGRNCEQSKQSAGLVKAYSWQ